MFVGTNRHGLDDKGRVILPAKWRDQFGGRAFISHSIDGCLSVRTSSNFEETAARLQEASRLGKKERDVARVFAADAEEVNVDKQGRVAIPQLLRTYGGLQKEVLVIGAIDRVEIWDPIRWEAVHAAGEASLGAGEAGLASSGI